MVSVVSDLEHASRLFPLFWERYHKIVEKDRLVDNEMLPDAAVAMCVAHIHQDWLFLADIDNGQGYAFGILQRDGNLLVYHLYSKTDFTRDTMDELVNAAKGTVAGPDGSRAEYCTMITKIPMRWIEKMGGKHVANVVRFE